MLSEKTSLYLRRRTVIKCNYAEPSRFYVPVFTFLRSNILINMNIILDFALTLVIIALAILIITLIITLALGVPSSVGKLEEDIRNFLDHCDNNALMTIKVSYFLVGYMIFRKYIRKPDDFGIEFLFPKRKKLDRHFNKIKELCSIKGIEYDVVRNHFSNRRDYLRIDFSTNTGRAYWFVRRILSDVFRVREDITVFVFFKDRSGEKRRKREMIERFRRISNGASKRVTRALAEGNR